MSRAWGLRWVANLAAGLITVVAVLGGLGLLPGVDPGQRPEVQMSAAEAKPTDVRDVAGRHPRSPGRQARERAREPKLPAASGEGRRIVFDQSAQRVWLVGRRGVTRTYLVSGSNYDNLTPGTYRVYSRSRWAVGVDDSGVMQFYVRFARGTRSTIGFHTIPRKSGVALQTRKELGTPQSHGCIRQARADAIALWRFAPVGTVVVVVA